MYTNFLISLNTPPPPVYFPRVSKGKFALVNFEIFHHHRSKELYEISHFLFNFGDQMWKAFPHATKKYTKFARVNNFHVLQHFGTKLCSLTSF